MRAPRNIGGLVTTRTALRPVASAAAGSFGLTGIAINRSAFQSALLKILGGALTGSPTTTTIQAKIQDSADGSTFADVAVSAANPAVAITNITAANSDRFLELDLSGMREFVRVVLDVAFSGGSSPTAFLAADLVLGGPQIEPTVHA